MSLLDHRKVKKPLPHKDLILEIGFGRGDFLIKLARENPTRKVMGLEVSGIAIERILKRIRRENLNNLLIAQLEAYWGVYLLLADRSLRRIHINYPDPWFKKRHIKRRLTSREHLYIFAKRLEMGGEIILKTDHYPFLEYTLENATALRCFEIAYRKILPEEPTTKYEAKWIREGKDLYELKLTKLSEPAPMKVREIKEVDELFPVRVESEEINPSALESREIKIGEEVYLRFFKVHRCDDVVMVESLLSERGYTQRFVITFKRSGGSWVVDISPFSEVLRTENLQRAVEVASELAFRP